MKGGQLRRANLNRGDVWVMQKLSITIHNGCTLSLIYFTNTIDVIIICVSVRQRTLTWTYYRIGVIGSINRSRSSRVNAWTLASHCGWSWFVRIRKCWFVVILHMFFILVCAALRFIFTITLVIIIIMMMIIAALLLCRCTFILMNFLCNVLGRFVCNRRRRRLKLHRRRQWCQRWSRRWHRRSQVLRGMLMRRCGVVAGWGGGWTGFNTITKIICLVWGRAMSFGCVFFIITPSTSTTTTTTITITTCHVQWWVLLCRWCNRLFLFTKNCCMRLSFVWAQLVLGRGLLVVTLCHHLTCSHIDITRLICLKIILVLIRHAE